jgi:hypothetical protein
MFRFVRRAILLLIIALPIAAAVALWLALENTPRITDERGPQPREIAAAREKLGAADPRTLTPGSIATIALTPRELTTAANYLLRGVAGRSSITTRDNALVIGATVPAPVNPIGRYLNVTAVLRGDNGPPALASLRIGHLDIPAFIGNLLVRHAPRWLGREDEAAEIMTLVREIRVTGDSVEIAYEWNPDRFRQLRAHLIPPEELERLRVQNETLAKLVGDPRTDLPLVSLMRAMIRNGSASHETAADNNRAMTIVLAAFAAGKDPGGILPEARDWPVPKPQRLMLLGREDLAQHFIVSAAISMAAGSAAADAIGLGKELQDSLSGSGFSFADLAADRAGARFGALFADPARAAGLAAFLATRARDEDLMPSIAGLPEHLTDEEFKKHYESAGNDAYNALVAAIDARIARMPLYR